MNEETWIEYVTVSAYQKQYNIINFLYVCFIWYMSSKQPFPFSWCAYSMWESVQQADWRQLDDMWLTVRRLLMTEGMIGISPKKAHNEKPKFGEKIDDIFGQLWTRYMTVILYWLIESFFLVARWSHTNRKNLFNGESHYRYCTTKRYY